MKKTTKITKPQVVRINTKSNEIEKKPLQTFDELLVAMASSDPAQRHHAAYRLEEFTEDAVTALFKAIDRPQNRNYTGTLVYVLRSFNCEDRFTALFELALYGGSEVQIHALYILWRQYFVVTTEQLQAAEKALKNLRERESLTADDIKLLRKDLQSILKRIALSIPKNK